MLEGCTEDEEKSNAVPEGHGFAERACKRGGCLCVGAVAQLVQLRGDEGGHGELVACHEPDDGGSGYVVSGCPCGIGCSALGRRIVKWQFQKEVPTMAPMGFSQR